MNWRARIDFWDSKCRRPTNRLRSINSTGCAGDKNRQAEVERFCEHRAGQRKILDLRDGYALTRELYKQAWLRDNRPYWLENNLARYDQSTQLWIERSDRFGQR